MPNTTDKLVPIEYKSLPGVAFRKKLRGLGPQARGPIILVLTVCALLPFFTIMQSPAQQFAPWLVLFVLLLIFCGLAMCISRDEIFIGEHGLSFPLPFMHKLGFRPTRLWSELEQIEVLSANETEKPTNKTRIRLTFKDGDQALLSLHSFSKDGINLFVGAAAEWASSCRFDNQFEQLPKLFEYETGQFKNISYTQFWEEQLANTYTFTAFVPLQVGHRLRNDTLTVVSQVASGGFSAIYLVKSGDGKKMIVKESVTPGSLDEAAKEKIREQFRREAALLMKLQHDSIAHVHDHFVEAGRSYLLMDYITGPDLRAFVRQQGPQSEPIVRDWFNQMCDVLKYLHGQDPPIVHRDISPENIIVSENNRLIVIDFGAANEFIGQATGTLVGKQSYIAPEQIRGKACPQSDIYSLGATIYFALTGDDPEPLSSCSPRKVKPQISEQLDRLVASCTKLDVAQRVGSASALQEELCSGDRMSTPHV